MMEFLYLAGFCATLVLVEFARREANFAEMRTHLIVSLLFLSLTLERLL